MGNKEYQEELNIYTATLITVAQNQPDTEKLDENSSVADITGTGRSFEDREYQETLNVSATSLIINIQ